MSNTPVVDYPEGAAPVPETDPTPPSTETVDNPEVFTGGLPVNTLNQNPVGGPSASADITVNGIAIPDAAFE